MVTDLSKVVVLPKTTKKNTEALLCSCPICKSRSETEQALEENMQEVKAMVEEMIESTSFASKDFQIDISYAQNGPTITTNDTDQTLSDSKMAMSYSNMVAKFIDSFNKKYRHYMVCKLQDNNETLAQTITLYDQVSKSSESIEVKLWHYQYMIYTLMSSVSILEEIQQQYFIDETVLNKLTSKAKSVKMKMGKIARKNFVEALSLPDFQPWCHIEDVAPSYAY